MYKIKNRLDLPVGENLQEQLMISLNFGLTPEAQGAHITPYFLTRFIHNSC
jgi:hypothetical protein